MIEFTLILLSSTAVALFAAFIYPSFFGGLKRDFVAWLNFLLSCKNIAAASGLLFTTAAGDALLGGEHATLDAIYILAAVTASFILFVLKRKGKCK